MEGDRMGGEGRKRREGGILGEMEGGSEHAADRCGSEGLPGIKHNILCKQVARTNMFSRLT